jgi:guanylate kinase
MCPPTKMYVYIVFTDTSRPKKATELNGVEYHFITREEMESALVAHRYLLYVMLPCSNPTYFFLCLICDLLI